MRVYQKTALMAAFACTVATIALFLAFPDAIPAEDPKNPGKSAVAEEVEPADNSYCLVCHLNYEQEKLVKQHIKPGVGCAKCHGDSEKHSGDEDGLTPPDKMFASSEVDAFCMTCHPKDKVLERDKLKKTEYHKEVFNPKAEEHLTCTECHGENHKMAVRTRHWDKKTRKLIKDDGVRMMYKNSPATEGVKAKEKRSKP